MDRRLVIFSLCVFAAVAGCTETRVIRDNSVAAQFSKLDGINGARVTMGDGSNAPKPKARPLAPVADGGNPWPGYNPFAHSQWSTNFKVTDPAGTNTTFSPTAPTLTGMPAPDAPPTPIPQPPAGIPPAPKP